MKQTLILLVFALNIFWLPAQEKIKFGNCPKELLEMQTYEDDPEAAAVVLHEDCEIAYSYNRNTDWFEVVTEYVVRIKILTPDGVDYASSSVPFYKGSSRQRTETVSGLQGFTYNLENGKVIKEKLSKNYIFTEDVTENHKNMKFALPSAKAGSVVEYKYKKISPFYSMPQQFSFQWDIPVQYGHLSFSIPEWYKFNREVKGFEYIDVKTGQKNQNIMLHVGDQTYNEAVGFETTDATVRNLPALRSEAMVWNTSDFRTGIRFEINGFARPGIAYRNFSTTWADVSKELMESEYFGKQIGVKGMLKDDLFSAIAGKTNAEEKIRSILDLVRSKVKWNDRATLFIDNPSKALREGLGSSGEINAILLNALRDAGFDANPVVMSLRSRGRIPLTHPSISNLNYFVVEVASGDQTYFLDGTSSYNDLNVLPPNCRVDRAIGIYPRGHAQMNLSNIGRNLETTELKLSFDEANRLTSQVVESYEGQASYAFQQRHFSAENQEKYVADESERHNITIKNYVFERHDKVVSNVRERYDFEKSDIQLGDPIVSFCPLTFFAMNDNIFKSETRKLPIEFPYPYTQSVKVRLDIPEGYEVDEIPAASQLALSDNNVIFSYSAEQVEGAVEVTMLFELKSSIIPATQYAELRELWSKMYSKENEMIVLKKH